MPQPKPPKDSLTLAIEERAKNPRSAPVKKEETPVKPSGLAGTDSNPIATVNGVPIPQKEFTALLIRSRGVALMEQAVGLAAAEEYARKQGVTVNEQDVEFEYDLALRRLLDPLAFTTAEGFERDQATQLLESILASRQMSHAEFMLTVRRNAFLRKSAVAQLSITQQQLEDEYQLAYGDRVQIRHIQVGNLADATRIKERLGAGEDFGELASRFSTNITTSRRGGLLDPFSIRDQHIPEGMRRTAANLKPGEVSEVIRIGEWYHLIKFEKQVPPDQRGLESVRDKLQKRIEVRLTDARMRELHEKLFKDASVQIEDPVLRELFQKVYPDLVRPAS